ncbi:MAG: hypothetical protein AABX47_00280 [Nanoarchaeota archaeon]
MDPNHIAYLDRIAAENPKLKRGNVYIEIHKQRKPYNSGQMCLAMLGYDWAAIMSGGGEMIECELTYSDMERIKGVTAMGATKAGNPVNYNETFMWGFIPKNELYAGLDDLVKKENPDNRQNMTRERKHWVIRYNDYVYCPIKGMVPSTDYEKLYIRLILHQFRVPHKLKKVKKNK